MYEIGQQILCVKSHSTGAVKEGKTYLLNDFKKNCQGNLVFDVGVIADPVCTDGSIIQIGEIYRCGLCEGLHKFDGIWWINASLFRPIDDLYNEEIKELTEVLNEPVTF